MKSVTLLIIAAFVISFQCKTPPGQIKRHLNPGAVNKLLKGNNKPGKGNGNINKVIKKNKPSKGRGRGR